MATIYIDLEGVILSEIRHACLLSRFSHARLFATLWTIEIACQAPLSMGFSRQKQWSGLPCPPPGHLPGPGIEPASPAAPRIAGRFFTTEPQRKPQYKADEDKYCMFSLVECKRVELIEIQSRLVVAGAGE